MRERKEALVFKKKVCKFLAEQVVGQVRYWRARAAQAAKIKKLEEELAASKSACARATSAMEHITKRMKGMHPEQAPTVLLVCARR